MKKSRKQTATHDTPWTYNINEYCWISKGKDATLIRKSLLGYYQEKGWSLGRTCGLRVYVRKENAIKRVAVEQAEEYFLQGWEPDLEFID